MYDVYVHGLGFLTGRLYHTIFDTLVVADLLGHPVLLNRLDKGLYCFPHLNYQKVKLPRPCYQ